VTVGRTVPTYRSVLEGVSQQWRDFRRALRREDREAFDSLVVKARMHSSAATYAVSLDPVESIILSMLLEHEKELMRLSRSVEGESGRGEQGP
jgi:hypothetical protein